MDHYFNRHNFISPFDILLLVKEVKLSSRENDTEVAKENIKQWKRSEVIKDYRFIIIALNMLAMPWIAGNICLPIIHFVC